MKRLPHCMLAFLLLAHFCSHAIDIWVAPGGSDRNDGSKQKPFASLQKALFHARELRRLKDPSCAGGVHIILRGGTYFTSETIVIRPEDNGTPGSPTVIEAAAGETPVLSGGMPVTGWRPVKGNIAGISPAAKGKLWIADVPATGDQSFLFRQLWVNGNKAVKAKSSTGNSMHRILDWNKNLQTAVIAARDFPGLRFSKGMEMFIHQWWAIAILRVKAIQQRNDSLLLTFQQPESRIQSEHPWPAPWLSKETGNSAFYLSNALSFLDEPGEWYLDHQEGKLYYWPRKGESMTTAHVIAPYTETLLSLAGTADETVDHVYFRNITFSHTGWLRPSIAGHVPHQNGLYMLEAYRLKPAGTPQKTGLDNQAWVGRPAAAVSVNFARHTGFSQCRFEHLASTGLDYHKGIKDALVEGNLFRDIGGNGILASVYSDEAREIHLPYNPADDREVCDSLVISNNLVTDATNEDWGCVGIGVGYSRNTRIVHNEVMQVSYTAISMGWGWSPAPNAMRNNQIVGNRIHHYGLHNYDCSGIYTLSAQPGSLIAENVIDSIYKAPYAHLPSHWFYLYTDEGSSGFTVRDNYSPATKYLQNANGPGNTWTGNGPAVNTRIIEQAGPVERFHYLLKERAATDPSVTINEEHREVIELVAGAGKNIDIAKLKHLLSENNMDSTAIYQWKDHIVVFDHVQDLGVMAGRLQSHFPDATVRAYHDLFYRFNRAKHCPGTVVAKEWDDVLLTANLVADPEKQQAYLDYHDTQFEKWPEVAAGFCAADFQELLVFRNGRQLMLVISIPRGESLDRLNPKTTENNPRMMEWNRIMSGFQEGIPGTKKGESWVFLGKVTE